MASKILVDELAPQSHATDVTLTTGKNITGANTQFKITGGSSGNHLSTDGSGGLTWVSPPGQGLAGAYTRRLQADYTTSGTTGTVVGNADTWAVDNTSGYASIGGTGSTSSGVFTLADVGIWRIDFYCSMGRPGSAPWERLTLQTSINTGGSWTNRSEVRILAVNAEEVNGSASCIFDCESTSTHLFRMYTDSGTSDNDVVYRGSATENITYVNFTKLGDT
jgi:hypothetical protein|tara:strand:- start:434 stop:1096 length:663 start_codon:yes stop_codon:yes gene_type:complete